ncbi:MAG: C-type lectin domain-containing protein [Muricomes sp.]
MKRSKNYSKILVAIIIIVVFIIGIGAGVMAGTMIGNQKAKEADKTTSESSSQNVGSKENGTSKDVGKKAESTDSQANSGTNTGTDSTKDSGADSNQNSNAGTGDDTKSNPSDWQDNTDIHRYEYIVRDVTWQEAFQDCIDRGGYLVRINSSSEYEYIRKEISSQKMTNIFFCIGGKRDSNSSDYYWVNQENKLFGEKLNSDSSWCADEWKNGEPSYKDGKLDELYMDLFFSDGDKRFVWNDIPDDMLQAEPAYSGKIGYICEYED